VMADYDTSWVRRARSTLGYDKVGSDEDLADPEHRKWLRRKMRKKKGQQQAQTGQDPAPAPAPEEPPAPGTPDEQAPAPEQPGIPVGQGTARQFEGRGDVGGQLKGLFPERRVEGEQGGPWGNMPQPGGERQMPTQELREQGGPWGNMPPDAGDQAGGMSEMGGPWGNMPMPGGGMFTGTGAPGRGESSEMGEPYVTNAGMAPPDYPRAKTGGGMAQPSAPWPPPPAMPTFYTGGM
jgi:hypothetical protein